MSKRSSKDSFDTKQARKHLTALKHEVDLLREAASIENTERGTIRWGQLDALGAVLQAADSIL